MTRANFFPSGETSAAVGVWPSKARRTSTLPEATRICGTDTWPEAGSSTWIS